MKAVYTPADVADLERRVSLFKGAMRRLASGVSLVTSGSPEHGYAGLIATSVVSLSMDPPTLLVCVNQSSSAHPVIEASGAFCVNLLSSSDFGLVDIFGSSARRDERFEVGSFEAMQSGSPRLMTALASIDCKVVNAFSYGTHTLFLGTVVDIQLPAHEQRDAMVYMNRAFQSLSSPDDVLARQGIANPA